MPFDRLCRDYFRFPRHDINASALIVVTRHVQHDNRHHSAVALWFSPFISTVAVDDWCTTTDMDPTYPLVPLFNLLFFIAVLLPLPVLLQSWNSGICMTILWTATNCLTVGLNAVLWKDNIDDSARVWCEISTC